LVVTFSINFPELYHYYVPPDATYFLTIYDTWGEKKLFMFAALGLRTEILWRKTPATPNLNRLPPWAATASTPGRRGPVPAQRNRPSSSVRMRGADEVVMTFSRHGFILSPQIGRAHV